MIRPTIWKWGAFGLLVATFMVDLQVPLGIAQPALYAVPLIFVVMARSRAMLQLVGLLAIALTLLVLWFQFPPDAGVPVSQVVINRLISVGIILIIVFLGLALLSRMDQLEMALGRLDHQQQLLNMAGRTARFGAWSYDLKDDRVIWTDEVAEIHQVESNDPLSLDEAFQFYAPEHRERIANALTGCLEHGTPFDLELKFTPARSGRKIWVRAIGEPVHDPAGELIGAQGAFQDIDARKRAEESAEANQERFRQLADAMPLFVWTTTAAGAMNFLNRFGLEFVGVSSFDDVAGDRWLTRLHPDDRDRTVERWMYSINNEAPYSTEFRLRRHDGQYRWHQASATAIRDQNGNTESWFGACIDIEEQRRLADRLVTTLENITDIFYAFDHEWRFVYLNAKGEEVSGHSREDLLGKVLWEAFPEVKNTEFHRQYLKAAETGKPVQFTEYYEPFNIWLDVTAYPTDDGLAVYLRDVTMQRQVDEQLRQAQRLESVGQLTGGIAHDFNNLLTVVIGNIDMIAELAEDHSEILPLAQMASRAAQRGSDLTRRLLAFARRQALEPRPTDVNRLVAGMDEMLRRTLGEHIEIEFARAAGLWRAMIDPGQLEDALLNLCLNARDAMPTSGKLTIETFNAYLDAEYAEQHDEIEPGQYVGVAVSDTGTGMEPETLQRIFEPFFSTKEKHDGTGLGLAMVFGFVKQSEGHIRAYSEPGQGTTIRMYLPRTRETAGESDNFRKRASGGDERILIVEDDELVRAFAVTQLKGLGYEVTEAADGQQALEILSTDQHFDLLFTDIVMPGGISGRKLAEEALRMRPDIRVLFTSGYTENAIVHHGRLDPGTHLLSKPYRRARLDHAIRRALNDDPPVI